MTTTSNTYIKYDPKDENIFCPLNYKDGAVGHGLLKKYYIPSLKKTVCDYCEVNIDGEQKTLCYFQGKRDCKHLIKDFGEYRDELLKVQLICNNNQNNKSLANNILNSSTYIENTVDKSNKYQELFKRFRYILEQNLLPFMNQIDDLKKVKELISQIKFDSQGRVNLTGIGNDSELESKLIWLSLFLINMRSLNSRDGDLDFDFSDDLIGLAREMVRTLYQQCITSFEFFRYFCNILLPEITKLESKENHLTYEELMKDFKLNDNDDKVRELTITILNQKDRIAELEAKLRDSEAVNRDILKYKDAYLKEVEKAESLQIQLQRQNKKLDDFAALNDSLKKRLTELELMNQRALQEKTDLKNYYDNLIKENEINLNEKLRQFEIVLREKDLIVESQRTEIDRNHENEKRLKDRIHELELHLLKEKENKKKFETNYEKLLGDYNILIKRHELFTAFGNETRIILNGN